MTVITELTVRQRVDAGWAVMDAEDPGWWREDASLPVDLAVLDLDEVDLCILGQRCPLELRPADSDYTRPAPFWAYAYVLADVAGKAAEGTWDDVVAKWAAQHGFTTLSTSDGMHEEFAELGSEWFRRITERRAAA